MQFSPTYDISLRSKYSLLLSTLFSNTLNLRSCPDVRDQVSYPYRTTGKITGPYILILVSFRQQARKQKLLDWMVARFTGIQSPINLLLKQTLICYCRSQIFELCHIFWTSVSYLFVSLPNMGKYEANINIMCPFRTTRP
jgi:hypothetical protein